MRFFYFSRRCRPKVFGRQGRNKLWRVGINAPFGVWWAGFLLRQAVHAGLEAVEFESVWGSDKILIF